jgi:heme-degrading monooxygenase HmoA
MYAHQVVMNLKHANGAPELTRTLENELIPLLRAQQGFREEITLVVPGGTKVVAISLWDKKESADAYHRGGYPEALNILAEVVEGNPRVEAYEVVNATFHRVEVRALADRTERVGLELVNLSVPPVDRR